MKKFIFFVLLLLTGLVFAQYIQSASGVIDAATGNLVYSNINSAPAGATYNWSGFGTVTTDGGGTSGGYQPGYNMGTGTFMFGYTPGTISYSSPVNFALSQAGTGIQVNGYQYSWQYINQDYTRGTLTGNISLTSTSGQTLQSYNYNMPQTTNGWTTMSGIQNFSTQYPAATVGNLNVSFTGQDDRYWAGYYGPQIKDISVSLLYSITPPPVQTNFSYWIKETSENGTFTLTSAGVVRYGENGTYLYVNFQPGTYTCSNSAWGKDPLPGVGKECDLGSNAAPVTTTSPTTSIIKAITATPTTDTTALLDPTTTTTTTTGTTTTGTTTGVTTSTSTGSSTGSSSSTSSSTGMTDTSSATSSNLIGSVTATPTIVSAPAPATTSTSSSNSSSSSSSSPSSSSAAVVTTAAVQVTKDPNGSPGTTNSLALSVISKNSDRDAAGSAVAQTAVAQAQAQANQAQQDAANVAANAVSNSTTGNAATGGSQASSGTGFRMSAFSTNFSLQPGLTTVGTMTGTMATTSTSTHQQNSSNAVVNVSTGQQVMSVNATQQQATVATTSSVVALVQPTQLNLASLTSVQTGQQIQQQMTVQVNNVSSQTVDTYTMVSPNALTDKTNPLHDIIEDKQLPVQSNTASTNGPAVNKNAQDSDVAGGVSISKMAIAPTGYGDYLNFTMRDVAFYAPKEVYKNQKNVDNARLLRQLTNDSKHREMVDQQYK
jgi:hypothetical protein